MFQVVYKYNRYFHLSAITMKNYGTALADVSVLLPALEKFEPENSLLGLAVPCLARRMGNWGRSQAYVIIKPDY